MCLHLALAQADGLPVVPRTSSTRWPRRQGFHAIASFPLKTGACVPMEAAS
jgi:hypothetical protein